MKIDMKHIKMLVERKVQQKFIDEYMQGLASGKNIKDIYAKYPNYSEDHLDDQYEQGIEVEYEHSKEREIAAKIALDHLMESPTYYTDLKNHVENHKNKKEALNEIFEEEEYYDNEEEDEELERDYDNSDNIQDILNHEELVEITKHINVSKKFVKPFARRFDTNNDDTSKECLYYLGELEDDTRLEKFKITAKKGYYAIEKFVGTVPKIEPRVYTGGYETEEECLENTINKLFDLENSNENTQITLLNMGLSYDFGS